MINYEMFEDKILVNWGKFFYKYINEKANLKIIKTVSYAGLPKSDLEFPCLRIMRLNKQGKDNSGLITSTIRFQYIIKASKLGTVPFICNWVADTILEMFKASQYNYESFENRTYPSQVSLSPTRLDYQLFTVTDSPTAFLNGMFTIVE